MEKDKKQEKEYYTYTDEDLERDIEMLERHEAIDNGTATPEQIAYTKWVRDSFEALAKKHKDLGYKRED